MWLTASHSRSIISCRPSAERLIALIPSSMKQRGCLLIIRSRNQKTGSILRPTWIHILVPEQYPAGHASHIFEALLAENLGELHRSCTAFAVYHDLLVRVR